MVMLDSQIILEMLQEKFPDGVSVIRADCKEVQEIQVKEAPLEDDTPLVLGIQSLILVELEPETGIYAVMSPSSHNVYVYIDEDQYL